MWNNYTVEMQNAGRIDDHLAEARANALEADARGAGASWLAVAGGRVRAAAALRIAAMRRTTGAAGHAAVSRVRAAAQRVAGAAVQLRHAHLHRAAAGQHRA
jgi:hypothetical protein